jgi:hypothetical protein
MSEFDKKISQLTGGAASQAADEYVINRGGANYKITGANVAAAATAVGTLAGLTMTGNLTIDTDVVVSRGSANRLDLASGDSLNLVSGTYKIGATDVLSSSTLGSGVTASSLTSVGTLTSLTVSGNTGVGGVLSLTGGGGSGLPAANGVARFASSTTDGAWVIGQGSSTDLNILNKNGDGVISIPTGTKNVVMSGNLGLGVTPSAWSTTALQVAQLGVNSRSSSISQFSTNQFWDGSNHKYIASAAATLYTQNAGAHSWAYAASGTAGNTITFTTAMTLDASGGLQVLNAIGVGNTAPTTSGAGITFPATQSASTNANTLDDYEEGTFTPTAFDAASGGNQAASYGEQEGHYTKIGNVVRFYINIAITSTSGMTGGNTLFIRGLPFASASISGNWYRPQAIIARGVTFSGYMSASVVSSQSYLTIRENVSNANGDDIVVSDLAASTAIQINGMYRVS